MRILIIRRDNIGDLVCTTPLISALRRRGDIHELAVLANSYNAPVLDLNPDVDHVHIYTKLKHRGAASLSSILLERLHSLVALRRQPFDHILIAQPNPPMRLLRLARSLRPGSIHTLASLDDKRRGEYHLGSLSHLHEVEDVFRLGTGLALEGPPPAVRVRADPARASALAATLPTSRRRIAVHISARKPGQRLPAETFLSVLRALAARHPVQFLLLWAPGPGNHPAHPGDDDKAAFILERGRDLPITPLPTQTLPDLIASLSLADLVLCSDGGAMHLAAGLGKPIVALFGNSNPERWRPWGVPHRLLAAPDAVVARLEAETIVDAVAELAEDAGLALAGKA